MFPTGSPGLALLLLRSSVALAVVAASYRDDSPGLLQGSAILVAVGLLAGCFTPIAAVVAVAVQCLLWLRTGLDTTIWTAVVSLDAIALALLGPGAYSVDAYFFGRRVVVLPPS